MSNIVEFPTPGSRQDMTDKLPAMTEADIRGLARANLAAAVAILMKGPPNDDLEHCLHHINEAWGQVAAVLILRDDP